MEEREDHMIGFAQPASKGNSNNCTGEHRYYVAETCGVESTGKLHIIYLCTACGNAKKATFEVAPPETPIRLGTLEKEKE